MSSRGSHGKHPRQRGRGYRGGNKINRFQGTQHKPWKHDNPNWDERQWFNRRSLNNLPHKKHHSHSENRSHHYEQDFANNYYEYNYAESERSNKETEEDGPPLPGSEADRSNKIELDKKRIREALSSATDINQSLNFKNSPTDSRSKEKLPTAKKINTPISELRLTANDLMEIGSVAGKPLENNDLEDNGDIMGMNIRHTFQRFHNVSNSSENVKQQNYKSSNTSQPGGWKPFQIPTEFTEVNFPDAQISTNTPNRNIREERILGDIVVSNEARYIKPKFLNMNDTDRIGRLYKSFLKARYFGGKMKLLKGDEPCKQKLQNPLLDTSVTEAQNNNNEDHEKRVKKHQNTQDHDEPEMPLPMQIKMEMMESNVMTVEIESKEELEADEFLKEFSHLLTPNLKIPDETLEQLGLSHLLEDYPLTEEVHTKQKKGNNFSDQSSCDGVLNKSDSLLRVKSLSMLNSTPFIDNIVSPVQTSRRNEIISSPSELISSTLRHSLSPVSLNSLPSASPSRLLSNQSFHIPTENENSVQRSAVESSGLNVEHVVNEVVEKILNTSRVASLKAANERSLIQAKETTSFPEFEDIVTKLKINVNKAIDNEKSFAKELIKFNRPENINIQNDYSINNKPSTSNQSGDKPNITGKSEQIGKCSQSCHSSNQLVDVSDKILKMFLIDKQIQELMEEKIKLYNELMSTKEIASRFFNSWAKDKQGMGITHRMGISNTSVPTQTVLEQGINQDLDLNNVLTQNLIQNVQDNTVNMNSNSKPSTSSIEPSGLNDLVNNVEAVKQYLMSFQSNTIADAVNACKESLLEIKKEAMVKAENTLVSNENSNPTLNSDVQSDSEKEQRNNKRKKKNSPFVGNSNSEKKKRRDVIEYTESNQNKLENSTNAMQNLNMSDDIIEIISDEENDKFENLYETKFEPSSLNINIKEPKNNEVNIKKKNKKKDDSILQFNHQEVTVLCMKISESQQVCVTGCRDGQLLIYSLSSGKLKGKLKGHSESITCLSEHKGLVISGSTDSTLRCFHIKSKTELYCVDVGYAVQCMDLKYGTLFVGTKIGLLYTYAVKETLNLIDDPLNITDSSILAVKAAKEGVRNILIVAARGQQITIRDATTEGVFGYFLENFLSNTCTVHETTPLHQNDAKPSKTVQVLSKTDGGHIEQCYYLSLTDFASFYLCLLIRTFNWCDTVYCLEIAGESPIVYCGTKTKSVVAVDFINGEEIFKCNAGRGVTQICFAHDLMFTACYDGKVYIYDYKKKSLVTSVSISKGILLSLIVFKNQIIVGTTRNEFLAVPFPQELKKYLNSEDKS